MDKAGIWTIIGDRINPGFKATKQLVEDQNLAGLQALAVRQVETGADALDFTLGPDARFDAEFLKDAIVAVQEAVDAPLCFDYPESETQRLCLNAYDPGKAGGAVPIINSIAETRWEMVDLLRIQPCKITMMVSERLEDGAAKPNQTAEEMATTAKRTALRLRDENGVPLDDIIIDVSLAAVAGDMEGHNQEALHAMALIRNDPDLAGIHITGGIINLGGLLPPKAADGSSLREQVECAFLTLAQPLGMDTIIGTPWRDFRFLPDDSYVLCVLKEILDARGMDVMRKVRKLYTPQRVTT
jgi:cobalamin-dependent methionine synthase I